MKTPIKTINKQIKILQNIFDLKQPIAEKLFQFIGQGVSTNKKKIINAITSLDPKHLEIDISRTHFMRYSNHTDIYIWYKNEEGQKWVLLDSLFNDNIINLDIISRSLEQNFGAIQDDIIRTKYTLKNYKKIIKCRDEYNYYACRINHTIIPDF